jgi:rhamnosyltransferase subunit B
VVAEYSPTLCLAALGRAPTVVIGTGFSLPPPEQETFPLFRRTGALLYPEERLLETARLVQRQRDRPQPERLPAILAGDRHFTLCVSDLDPFASGRLTPVVGPLDPPPAVAPPIAPDDFFAYLAPEFPSCATLLRALGRSGLRGQIFVRNRYLLRDVPPEVASSLVEHPVPLATALARARMVVHHGGLGVSQAALFAGRPQVVAPGHMEQAATARALDRLGAGVWLKASTDEAASAGLEAARAPDVARRAGEVASRLHAAYPQGALAEVTDACLALLAGARPSPPGESPRCELR